MHLKKPNQKPAADFLNGPVWQDIRRCLFERCPPHPDAKDEPHVAAAKGHQRAGAEYIITTIEKLPFEFVEPPPSPFERPAVSITAD